MLAAGIGILLLDPTQLGALYSSGSGGVHVLAGGSLVIDSTNRHAAVDVGAGNISAGAIQVTGGLEDGGPGDFVGALSHPAGTSDPFTGLVAPTITTPVHKAVKVSGNTSITLSPGTYKGGIHISGNATVTLLPGVYDLEGGGLSVVGNGTLTGTGVTIYNGAKKPSDELFIAGHTTVSLTAPNSGDYQNIVFFQNRNSAAEYCDQWRQHPHERGGVRAKSRAVFRQQHVAEYWREHRTGDYRRTRLQRHRADGGGRH